VGDFGVLGLDRIFRRLIVLTSIFRFEFVAVCDGVSIIWAWVTPATPATPARGAMVKTGVKTGVTKPSLHKDFIDEFRLCSGFVPGSRSVYRSEKLGIL
jgi:hypothetical protein